MRRQQAEQNSAAVRSDARGGQGVHREMESEGLASNLRAVAKGESQANRAATSALIRACSLEAKKVPAERVQTDGVCGRYGGTEERQVQGGSVGKGAGPGAGRPAARCGSRLAEREAGEVPQSHGAGAGPAAAARRV